MRFETIVKDDDVKYILAELSATQYFAIRTAIRVALHTDILPKEDRTILEEIISVEPTIKVVEE
jgi:hypothetical protein